MSFNKVLFECYYDAAYEMFGKIHPVDLNTDGIWLESPSGMRVYYKFVGKMITAKGADPTPCTNCQSGWLWDGIGAKYHRKRKHYERCYYGEFHKGIMNGFGFEDKYFGEFKAYNQDGFGCSLEENDKVYIGEFKHNYPHGEGRYIEMEHGEILQTFGIWEKGVLVDEYIKSYEEYDMEKFHEVIIECHSRKDEHLDSIDYTRPFSVIRRPPNVWRIPPRNCA